MPPPGSGHGAMGRRRCHSGSHRALRVIGFGSTYPAGDTADAKNPATRRARDGLHPIEVASQPRLKRSGVW